MARGFKVNVNPKQKCCILTKVTLGNFRDVVTYVALWPPLHSSLSPALCLTWPRRDDARSRLPRGRSLPCRVGRSVRVSGLPLTADFRSPVLSGWYALSCILDRCSLLA